MYKNKTNENVAWYIFGLLVLSLFVYLLKSLSKKEIESVIRHVMNMKIKKGFLVQYYALDKTTFRKWLTCFCHDILDVKENLKKRTFTFFEALSIINRLGFVEEQLPLSKKAIIKLCEGSYRSLKNSIAAYPDHFGISKEVYVTLRLLPPNVCKQILKQYS